MYDTFTELRPEQITTIHSSLSARIDADNRGNKDSYNTMTASWGGLAFCGIKTPASSWCGRPAIPMSSLRKTISSLCHFLIKAIAAPLASAAHIREGIVTRPQKQV